MNDIKTICSKKLGVKTKLENFKFSNP